VRRHQVLVRLAHSVVEVRFLATPHMGGDATAGGVAHRTREGRGERSDALMEHGLECIVPNGGGFGIGSGSGGGAIVVSPSLVRLGHAVLVIATDERVAARSMDAGGHSRSSCCRGRGSFR